VSLIPGSIAARDVASILHPYTNLSVVEEQGPMIMARAEGIHMWDDQGNKYIEGLAGLWCTTLGYANEEIAQTAFDQIKQLSYSHMFLGKSHEPGILLAEKIKEIVPMEASKVFFGCSGSDANDTQVKLLWYYNNAIGRPEKKKIISRIKAYHGITLAATSLTGLAPVHAHFDAPLNERFLHTDPPYYYRFAEPGESEEDFSTRLASNLEKMILDEDPDTVAAFIAEPVMGAGGVLVPPAGYFEKVQAVLDRYDIMFIVDEVITGFGRTGNPFGSQTFNIKPDTMSLAKGLTSAYQPLSAVVIPEKMYAAIVEASDEVGNFAHGYTFSGHPVAAAVGLKVLEIYEREKIYDRAAALGPRFQQCLQTFADHPLVGDARGVGMIGACELVADKSTRAPFDPADKVGLYCLSRCQAHGLIIRAMGDIMAFCPPLIVSDDEVGEIFERFGRALDETHAWVVREGLTAV
jgi:4-aminobutyrate---pyruvate transaminase